MRDDALEIASAALAELNEQHAKFMQFVKALPTKAINGGAVDSDAGTLAVTCLGVAFDVAPRPIVVDEYLQLLEYAFVTKIRDKEQVVWRMYLRPDDGLYSDLACKDRICDITNPRLPERLIRALASALMKSPVFRPLE